MSSSKATFPKGLSGPWQPFCRFNYQLIFFAARNYFIFFHQIQMSFVQKQQKLISGTWRSTYVKEKEKCINIINNNICSASYLFYGSNYHDILISIGLKKMCCLKLITYGPLRNGKYIRTYIGKGFLINEEMDEYFTILYFFGTPVPHV